jgi:hypothetical protein
MNILRSCAAGMAAVILAAAAAAQTRGAAPPVFPVSLRPAGSDAGAPAAGALRQDGGPPAEGGKSVGLAVIYSLLLPGMGELYAGDYGSGKYFTGADGVLWLGLGAVDLHARSMRDDARAFAALHAGFDPGGKDDSYFVNVSNFDDVYGYNEQVLRDRDAYKLYDPSSSYYWKWDSGTNRSVYRDQRVAADGMFNNTRFVIAALVANRVLSAINAARIVISGKGDGSGPSLDLGAGVLGGPAGAHGVALTLTRQF